MKFLQLTIKAKAQLFSNIYVFLFELFVTSHHLGRYTLAVT
ncbi:MAG: hypothetical protein WCP92_08955 [bacterium]